MAITALDTHQTVKELTAAGFTDAQAEAVTSVLRQVQQIDLSDLVTKADLKTEMTLLRAEIDKKMAELKAEMIRWVFGIAIAQVATIVAILKLFPSTHP